MRPKIKKKSRLSFLDKTKGYLAETWSSRVSYSLVKSCIASFSLQYLISANLDPFGIFKLQFQGCFETNIVVKFGLIRSRLVLTSLNQSHQLGTETLFENFFSEVIITKNGSRHNCLVLASGNLVLQKNHPIIFDESKFLWHRSVWVILFIEYFTLEHCKKSISEFFEVCMRRNKTRCQSFFCSQV